MYESTRNLGSTVATPRGRVRHGCGCACAGEFPRAIVRRPVTAVVAIVGTVSTCRAHGDDGSLTIARDRRLGMVPMCEPFAGAARCVDLQK
jgi:hypothetical protein